MLRTVSCCAFFHFLFFLFQSDLLFDFVEKIIKISNFFDYFAAFCTIFFIYLLGRGWQLLIVPSWHLALCWSTFLNDFLFMGLEIVIILVYWGTRTIETETQTIGLILSLIDPHIISVPRIKNTRFSHFPILTIINPSIQITPLLKIPIIKAVFITINMKTLGFSAIALRHDIRIEFHFSPG